VDREDDNNRLLHQDPKQKLIHREDFLRQLVHLKLLVVLFHALWSHRFEADWIGNGSHTDEAEFGIPQSWFLYCEALRKDHHRKVGMRILGIFGHSVGHRTTL